MLFREIIAVYCDSHTKHTNTLFGQNTESLYCKAGGTYRTTGLQGVRNASVG
jgi:hypothetical protein